MDGETVCILPLNSNFLFSPGFAARHRAESTSCRQVISTKLFLLLASFLYHVYGEVMNRLFSLKWNWGGVWSVRIAVIQFVEQCGL